MLEFDLTEVFRTNNKTAHSQIHSSNTVNYTVLIQSNIKHNLTSAGGPVLSRSFFRVDVPNTNMVFYCHLVVHVVSFNSKQESR